MNIDKYSEFWQEKDKWFLDPVSSGGYLITGHNERGEYISVGIEDDDISEAVIQKMIEEGVKILTPEEAQAFSHVDFPEDFDAETAFKLLGLNLPEDFDTALKRLQDDLKSSDEE